MHQKTRLIFAPILASVLLGSTIGPATAGASSLPLTSLVLNSNLKIHPLLQYGAQASPSTVVRVIIQQVHVPSTNLVGNLLGGLLGGSTTSSSDEQFTVIPALVKSVQLGGCDRRLYVQGLPERHVGRVALADHKKRPAGVHGNGGSGKAT